jgi:hypothetical protein
MGDRTEPTLPPEVFESVVNALADTLIRDYRERWSRSAAEPDRAAAASNVGPAPTWLKIADAAKRRFAVRCGLDGSGQSRSAVEGA